jgi:hypothetical protein
MNDYFLIAFGKYGVFDSNQLKFVLNANTETSRIFNNMNVKEQIKSLMLQYYNPTIEPYKYKQLLNHFMKMHINNSFLEQVIQEVSNNQNGMLA